MTPEVLEHAWRVRVEGAVQGVGFRPAAACIARDFGLHGTVYNEGDSAVLEVLASRASLNELLQAIRRLPPPTRIDRIEVDAALAVAGTTPFSISSSSVAQTKQMILLPDSGICEQCVSDLRAEDNRRQSYAMIGCSSCGPRFSTLQCAPFDRVRTTYGRFKPCSACEDEYGDPRDRRYHSQLIACAACGPRHLIGNQPLPDAEIVSDLVSRLIAGSLCVVKGLSGIHILADARSDDAVTKLRLLKDRAWKPFAVTVETLLQATELVELGPEGVKMLAGPARPIVIGRAKPASSGLSPCVTLGIGTLGVMLPSTGLMLMALTEFSERTGRTACLVVTSANLRGGRLPATLEAVSVELLAATPCYVDHEREISWASDDSVVLDAGADVDVVVARAGRGLAPVSMSLKHPMARSATGISTGPKGSIAIAAGEQCILLPHVGESLADSLERLAEDLEAARRVFGDITQGWAGLDLEAPRVVESWLKAQGTQVVRVQHHFAHAVAAAADVGLDLNCEQVALVCDGHGLGLDGSEWGCEVLSFSAQGFRRLGSLSATLHPPGTDRDPELCAMAYLFHTNQTAAGRLRPPTPQDAALLRLIDRRSPLCTRSSSTGRLFDAASALLGITKQNRFEGHAAMLLQAQAERALLRGERSRILPSMPLAEAAGLPVLQTTDWFAAAATTATVEDSSRLALSFHDELSSGLARLLDRCLESRPRRVVVTGGCLQNWLLRMLVRAECQELGIEALFTKRIPPNDGGLSVGLAVVARAADSGSAQKEHLA